MSSRAAINLYEVISVISDSINVSDSCAVMSDLCRYSLQRSWKFTPVFDDSRYLIVKCLV